MDTRHAPDDPMTPPEDPSTLDDLIDRVAKRLDESNKDRRKQTQETQVNRVNLTVGIFAVTSIIFSIGLSWGRVAELERVVNGLTNDVRANSRSIADQSVSGAVFRSQLDRIQQDVSDIKVQVFKRP